MALTGLVVTKVDVEVLEGKLGLQAERISEMTRTTLNKVDTCTGETFSRYRQNVPKALRGVPPMSSYVVVTLGPTLGNPPWSYGEGVTPVAVVASGPCWPPQWP